MKRELILLSIVVLVASVVLIALGLRSSYLRTQSSTPTPIASASFLCSGGKTIAAAFYEGSSTPSISPDEPPTPGGSAIVTLSDGRVIRLAQTVSADGGRYANADESFVFWTKGNGALVLTHGAESEFTQCVAVQKDPGGLSNAYESRGVFSIRYPQGFVPDSAAYVYEALGPEKLISGTKFTIDPLLATGTNLSSDSYVSVEMLPEHVACDASAFLTEGVHAYPFTEDGLTYSVASSTDAAVGNRYEEHVYAITGTDPCIAVRYFIHYGAIENYPDGSVVEFDHSALMHIFDSIRRSLTSNE